jgi:molybdopterin converting factor small subunit
MRITVRLLASYRRFLPEDHDANAGFPHEVAPKASVGEVLAGLPIPPGEAYTFFVNGRHSERSQILRPDDVLSVFPAVGGG